MAHFDIISSQGQHPVIWSGAPKYVGAYLKPGYLEFPAIGSPTPLSWHVGDYVVYSRTGKTYRLYRTPQAVEQGLSNKYGASFLYENVQFFDDSKQLEFCPFTDLVPGDNTVHFSTQNVVSFFGKPANVAERIQACLEAQYGAGTWEVRVVTTSDADLLEILNTEIEFSVTGANCQEVLDKVYEQWNGLGWIHTVENGKNVITIGASNVRTNANTTVPFAFDNGLVRVERSIANADQIGTRLFAYGSMKNMDATYYRGLDIKDAESVDIEHLMIPIANWGITDGKPDARKAYIENATAIASLGLIPKTAYFDGSGDLPDIHPTIDSVTIGEVYDAGGAGYIPDLSKWSRTDRIDEIVSASNPVDHGTAADQGQKYIDTQVGNLSSASREFLPDEEVSIGIYSTTVDYSGSVSVRFARNPQTVQLVGVGDPLFNLAVAFSIGGVRIKEVPITPVYASSSNWEFTLPESIVVGRATAGNTLNVSIVGFVSGGAVSQAASVRLLTDSTTRIEVSVEHEISKTFSIRVPQIGFDIEKYAALGNGKTISVRNGMCAGRDFEIKDVAYNSTYDAWDLTLYRSTDEDLNIMFPNADYEIASGDQYVLLDIAMPEMYVTVASSRLLAAAQKLLADISSEKPFYNPQVDAKVVYNEGRILREGMWMDITQEGNQTYCLIDSITIDENGSNIPTYEVALREKKGIDWTENVGKSGSSKSSVSVKGGEEVKTNGTVTSVGMTAPTGLEVEGSPITGTGVLKLKLASGYKIPLESELAAYFEQDDQIATLVKLKAAYSYLGPRKGLIFDSVLENDTSDADLYVKWVGEGANRQRVLYSPLALITEGDQIVGSGTPGQGGGGGAGYLYELHDVADSLATPTSGMVLQYNGSEWVGVQASTIGGVTSVVGQTGAITAAQISAALNLGAAATYGIGSVASGNTGLVTGGSVYSAINSALTSVLKFVGVTTTEITDGSTTNPVIINGSSYTAVTGNVVLYGAKEYLWTGSAWEEMGDEASWALKTITITAGTGLTGGGNLTANRTLSLSQATRNSLALADSAIQPSDLKTLTVQLAGTQIGSYTPTAAATINITKANLTGLLDDTYHPYGGGNIDFEAKAVTTTGNITLQAADRSILMGAEGSEAIVLRRNASNLMLGSGTYTSLPTLIYGTPIRFLTHNGTAQVEGMRILANGRVAINSTTSSYQLYVNGTLGVSGLSTLTGGATIPATASMKIGDATITWVANSGNGYLKIDKPLLTEGDQIVGSGTPGGGGEGAGYLYELKDTISSWTAKPSVSATQVLVFDPSATDKNSNTGAWKYVPATDIGRIYRGGTGITIGNDNTISVTAYTYAPYYANGYVKKDGDTMSGALTFSQGSSTRRNGIIGTYDANRAAAIWSMGSSYQIAADGMTMGNLYGACYAYYGSGYTYGAGKSGGHSFVWCENGTPKVALGQNVWTSGGFIKDGSSNDYFLLGGGGHVARSTYALSSSLADYLPLSGGILTISNQNGFEIKRNHASYGPYIQLSNTSGTMGWIGMNGASSLIFVDTTWGNNKTIYHSGNSNKSDVSWTCSTLTSSVATGTAPLTVASATMVENLNANYLDGWPKEYFVPMSAYSFATGYLVKTKLSANANMHILVTIEGTAYNYSPILSQASFYTNQTTSTNVAFAYPYVVHYGRTKVNNLQAFLYGGYLYIWFQQPRAYCGLKVKVCYHSSSVNYVDTITNEAIPSSGVTCLTSFTEYQGAFTDSNVASATKLQNERTIWGQSFDGTGNVSGALSGATTGAFSSNVTVGGTLGVTGATTLSSTLTTSGDILPSGNNTYNLGSSSYTWASVYLGTSVIFPASTWGYVYNNTKNGGLRFYTTTNDDTPATQEVLRLNPDRTAQFYSNLTIVGSSNVSGYYYSRRADNRLYMRDTVTGDTNTDRIIIRYANGTALYFGSGTYNIASTNIYGTIIRFYPNNTSATHHDFTATGASIMGSLSATGNAYAPNLYLNRSVAATHGRISFYSSSYYTWFEYMNNISASPTGANEVAGSVVTTWARRSLIENSTGYGWVWESCANSQNATPVIMMELSSVSGTLVTKGDQVISSDINLKTHFKDITLTSEQIANAPAVSFDWKDGHGHSFGSIAQYWKPIVPEAVLGEEGNYTLAYGQLGAVLGINNGKAIFKLEQHETEQDKEIKELKAKVKEQSTEILRLKARLGLEN